MTTDDMFATTPFGPDTELRRWRRRQRELLASIPDWWLDRVKPPAFDPPGGLRAGQWERRLRELADTAIEPALEWLDAAGRGAVVAELEDLINRAVQRSGKMSLYDLLNPSLQILRAEKDAGARVPREVKDPAVVEAMHSGLVLLAWADEVADDDYCDARLLGGDSLE